jgi:hypothetical protein
MATTPDPKRVLVATVTEDKPLARVEVEILFRSLRRFGGALAQAPGAARFVDSVDPAVARRLESLGVAVDVVPRVDPRSPHANKIRMLEGVGDIDVLVALDNDVAVAGDFSAHLDAGSVGAKPEDLDPLTAVQWARLYDHFGLELPAERFRTTFTAAQIVAYFNTGVLCLPGQYVGRIHDTWMIQVRRLLDSAGVLPDVAKWRIYQEQFAFALALAAARVPFHALPLEMNFPTHAPVHPSWAPGIIVPALIHHHHRLWSDGQIMPTGCAAADARIAAVNELIVDEVRDALHDMEPPREVKDLGGDRRWPFPGTWWAQIETFKRRVDAVIPARDAMLMVDDQQFGNSVAGDRVVHPFPELDGHFAGPPRDDADAIGELERQRRSGARWLVFLRPAFWWLEHYGGLKHYLSEHFPCAYSDENVVIYRLAD